MSKPKKDKAMAHPAIDQNIGEITVPNPHRIKLPDLKVVRSTELRYDEDRTTAVRNLRDDPLARLHHRQQITASMYAAGRAWQGLYEQSQVGRIGSSGDLKEPVDGTPPTREPITDRQVKAGKRIRELDIALGKVGAIYVRDILGDGLTIAQTSERHGIIANKRELERLGHRFRECLTTLAKELGFTTKAA